jgi:hypothetical protein
MTSQYRHRRSSNPSTAFPAPLEPGEIAVNTANRQLAVGDAASGTTGAPLALLPVRFFDARAIYAIDDLVAQAGVLNRALVANGPGAFNQAHWLVIAGDLDPRYVQKAGDTMTGPLVLPGDPTTDPQAANKHYVDARVDGKSSVIVSDTPPVGVPDNTLWWESDTGILYIRFNDGNTVQWVIASPQPDTSMFVQRTGDTMSGNLTISKVVPALYLDRTSNAGAVIYGAKGGLNRWQMVLGTGAAESGGNTGSDFGLNAIADDGSTLVTTAFVIARNTGLVSLAGNPTAPLGAATKGYVDNSLTTSAVRYDAAQSLTPAQQQQARQNVYAAPFDALAYNGLQINGGMQISQEYGNAAISLVSGALPKYIIDGWQGQFTGATAAFNIAQTGPVVVGVPNTIVFQAVTGAAFSGASDFASIVHRIEGYRMSRLGWGSAAASPITISFWVNVPAAGTMAVSVQNSAGNRSYVVDVPIAGAFATVFRTVTIPGDIAGTWDVANGIGMQICFNFAAGSGMRAAAANTWSAGAFRGSPATTNFFATNGNTAYLAGVAVLPGAEAPQPAALNTAFILRPFDEELRLCQRHLWIWRGGQIAASLGAGTVYNASLGLAHVQFPVTMRAAPSFSYSALTDFYMIAAAGSVPPTGMVSTLISPFGCRIDTTLPAGYVTGHGALLAGYTANAVAKFDARL